MSQRQQAAEKVAESIPGAQTHGARVRLQVSFKPNDALRVAEHARQHGRSAAEHVALVAIAAASAGGAS